MSDDFYKSIKENLENRPEPSFREGAWKAMEKTLQASKENNNVFSWRRKWWIPLLLLLFIGLAASNFWLYRQIQTIKKNKNIVQIDTIYKSNIILQSDTIYRNKVIKEIVIVEKNPATNLGADQRDMPNFKNLAYLHSSQVNGWGIRKGISDYMESFGELANIPLLESKTDKSYRINGFSKKEDDLNVANLTKEEIVEEKVNSQMLPFEKLPSLYPQTLRWHQKTPDLLIEIPYIKKRKTLQQRVYEMRPKTFQLGINGGFTTTNNANLENIGGYTFGLKAQIGFAPNFRLWTEASFMELKYSADVIEETLGIPSIEPPQDNFEFQKAEVIQPTYQFGLGFQYLMNARKKWKPYLGIGYGMVAMVPYEVAYEFNDPLTDIDLTLEQVVKRNDLLKGQLLLNVGIEHQFSKAWTWNLEGMYRNGLGNNVGLSTPNILSIRSGFSYQF